MATTTDPQPLPETETQPALEHVDVLIIGAGLSGIGAARHIEQKLPSKSYTILESRGSLGGTWDLFRYPGIRSDSDMYTLCFGFKPWEGEDAIADGPDILNYLKETAAERGIGERIRFHHRVVGAEFSTIENRWTVSAERTDTGEAVRLSADFLFCCSGYYKYEQGFTPEFDGIERFKGTIVHPQHWPEDLDYAGKRVIVIGSGATAMTLVPAMAPDAEHVTMLQRSPSYVLSLPRQDAIANGLRKALGPRLAYEVTKWKNVALATTIYQLSQRRPELVKRLIRKAQEQQLPKGYDIDTHFKPRYNPWDQRLCLVPDGDLFRAIRKGRVSIATDTIDTFTETGIRLSSGEELEADVIITATGLNLQVFGGAKLAVDGHPVSWPETMAYKGMMLSGVPNFAYIVGYTNASWTLKADLVCDYVCRLLAHMDSGDYDRCVPERDPEVKEEPFMDFAAGYVLRSVDQFPKQGAVAPWRLKMNYLYDFVTLRRGSIVDDAMRFTRRKAPAH